MRAIPGSDEKIELMRDFELRKQRRAAKKARAGGSTPMQVTGLRRVQSYSRRKKRK